ncbi:MAG: SRPBCC family protein [Caulobacteraceae bacterium]
MLVKGDDGVVRAFLNSCRHRGMRLCRADRGRASFLRCAYHGWAYSKTGALVSAFAEEMYDADSLKKEELGLVPVTQVDSYRGMIFGTWSAEAPPLKAFLGDMTFYLDMFLGRTDGGVEVVGAPTMWEVAANWKFGAENACDNQHLYTAHGSVVELGLLPPDPMSLSYGHLIRADGGHVLHVVPGAPDPMFSHFGLPKALMPQLEKHLSPAQMKVAENTTYSVGNVFPNLTFLQVMVQGDAEAPPAPFLNFRIWQPTSPTTTRIWAFLMIDKEASPEYRKASYEAYVRTFGPSGIFEQDDMANWEECTRVNQGKIAQKHSLHHGMGLHMQPDPNFPGPGDAWPSSYGERAQLAFYAEWRRWMTEQTPWVR